MKKILAFLFFLCACMSAQLAWCMGSFSITRENAVSGSLFIISRTDASFEQTVKYRAVSSSALAGKHFPVKTGEVTFAEGQDTVHVTVGENAIGSVDIAYRYQMGLSRSYRFEVTDVNGYLLGYDDRAISYSSSYQLESTYFHQSITNLVYFTSNGTLSSGLSGGYYDVAHEGSANTEIRVTDGGYNQGYHTVSTGSFFTAVKASQSYLSTNMKCKLYATVYFDQKEEADGYQYIQIIEGTGSSSYDGDDPDGGVNDPSSSLYKACFILSYAKSGSTETNYHKQFFPHRYNHTDYANYTSAYTNYNEFSYSDAHLYQQKYKNSTYQASNSGSLVLSPTVNNLTVRFDAAGSGSDTWYFRNLKVRLALCDATRPSIITGDVAVSAGPYTPGQTVYISVPFAEIVQTSGNPTLTTSWGGFTYLGGSGSNVLTFCGTVPAGNKLLSITAIDGTIRDMAGNTLSDNSSYSYSKSFDVTPLSACTLNTSNTFISGIEETYRDDGSVRTPTPTVTYYAGTTAKALTEGTDYTVSYTNNNVVGTATVTITGKGNYTGSVSKNFRIRGVMLTDFTKSGDYYQISSVADLELLSLLVNRNTSAQSYSAMFQQTADIDFEGGTLKSMGGASNSFRGQYYGEGHTIRNMHITAAQDETYTGLFGNTSSNSIIQDLRLDNCTISGYRYVGAIAGQCQGVIQNCRVESTVTVQPANAQESYECFGGIAGKLFSGSGRVYGCYCAAVVTDNGKANCSYFGGIAGFLNFGYSYDVRNNVYAGSRVEAQTAVGAIIGQNNGGTQTKLINNLYLDSNLLGGVNGGDVAGASRAYAITLEDGVLLNGSQNTYSLSGYRSTNFAILTDTAIYSGAGSVIEVREDLTVPYSAIVFGYNDGSDYMIDGSSFTMPAADALVYAVSVYPEHEATCEHNGNIAYWYRNGVYYSDETCTTPIDENVVWIPYVPTEKTHHNLQPVTLKQDGDTAEYWETECGRFSDEACTRPYEGEIVEGGHYDSENGFYWVRVLTSGERTIELDNTVASFHVYDVGGAEGNYSNNCKGALVLVAPENYTLQVEGTVNTESRYYDYLEIYNGAEKREENKIIRINSDEDGVEKFFGPLTTTGRNMYLYFSSDGSLFYSGFDLIVTLVAPTGEATGIEQTDAEAQAVKFIKDAQIFIIRNDRTYTITGQEVR